MSKSPAGRLGELDLDGNPDGLAGDIRRTEVDATASDGEVVFSGAKQGRSYRIAADCPTDDCWSTGIGFGFNGPDGLGFDVTSGQFAGNPSGSLMVQPPGISGWYFLGSNTLILTAPRDGDFKGAMADSAHGNNLGSMLVIVTEMEGTGPPGGKLDLLADLCVTGSGGVIPPTSTMGTSRFDISVAQSGIVNTVEQIELSSLSHTFANDLIISLRSPRGTKVRLVSRAGAGSPTEADSDYSGDYVFNNTADSFVAFSGGTVTPGTYRSEGSLGTFVGEQLAGIWTLEVDDRSRSDTGSLSTWRLCLKVAETNQDISVESDPISEIQRSMFTSEVSEFPTISSGTGGFWSTFMPPDFVILNITAAEVGTVNRLVEVMLAGFDYTQAGDLHVVLQSPSGTMVTIFHRPGSTSGSTGNTGYFDTGNYRFLETGFPFLPDAGIIMPGTYARDPGDWPGTPNNMSIPIGDFTYFDGENITGTWKLFIFAWGIFDSGSIDSAKIVVDFTPPLV